MKKNETRLLVVDDEPEIREMIADYLHDSEDYLVDQACSGYEALEKLKNAHFDLVLSDINMPGMKGFDLLKEVKELYPHIKRVLITAYNVEDYLDLALKYDIGNIFAKTTPFNFQELSLVLNNLLTNDIFGIARYFNPGIPLSKYTVQRSNHLDVEAKNIVADIGDHARTKRLELVIVELLTNAIFYGIRNEAPDRKETWIHDFELPLGKEIEIYVAKDHEKYAISINDCGGRLRKGDVLYWLNRQTTRDESGLPLGLYDTHGRGFFIARRYIDRLIINIGQSHRTEVIIINYFSSLNQENKPLYINEI